MGVEQEIRQSRFSAGPAMKARTTILATRRKTMKRSQYTALPLEPH